MGNLYLLMGDLDRCKQVFTKIVEQFGQSPRASMAHFKRSDLCYLDHDNSCAIKHLEKVKENEVDLQTWEMVHYRKGEMYYNMGDFDKAMINFIPTSSGGGLYKKRIREWRWFWPSAPMCPMAEADRSSGQQPPALRVLYHKRRRLTVSGRIIKSLRLR
jgi:hypothetical protein